MPFVFIAPRPVSVVEDSILSLDHHFQINCNAMSTFFWTSFRELSVDMMSREGRLCTESTRVKYLILMKNSYLYSY